MKYSSADMTQEQPKMGFVFERNPTKEIEKELDTPHIFKLRRLHSATLHLLLLFGGDSLEGFNGCYLEVAHIKLLNCGRGAGCWPQKLQSE